MPEFHPILTTDYFEYGTTANQLDGEGAAVEMGDAVLGLACQELAHPPHWAIVRNMSDPVINGDLPAKHSTSTNKPPGPSATTPPTANGPAPSAPSPPGASSPVSNPRTPADQPGHSINQDKATHIAVGPPREIAAMRIARGAAFAGHYAKRSVCRSLRARGTTGTAPARPAGGVRRSAARPSARTNPLLRIGLRLRPGTVQPGPLLRAPVSDCSLTFAPTVATRGSGAHRRPWGGNPRV